MLSGLFLLVRSIELGDALFCRGHARLFRMDALTSLLDTIKHFLQFDLHDADGVAALRDTSLKLHPPLVISRRLAVLVKLG